MAYLAQQWDLYTGLFRSLGAPLSQRDETTLTDGLATFLVDEAARGQQPFHGDFLSETTRAVLLPDGTAKTIGRTDLEWRLFGFPALVVEFKILGPGRKTGAYLREGLARFVDGRYASKASEGALCALVRPGAKRDPIRRLEALLDKYAITYGCVRSGPGWRTQPSVLAPSSARFDTLHDRINSQPQIRIAHMFLDIPPSP